jgi:hypothetical protein
VLCNVPLEGTCAISFNSLFFDGGGANVAKSILVREEPDEKKTERRLQLDATGTGLEIRIFRALMEKVKALGAIDLLGVGDLDTERVASLTSALLREHDWSAASDWKAICSHLRRKLLRDEEELFCKERGRGDIRFRNVVLRNHHVVACTTDFVDLSFLKCHFHQHAKLDMRPLPIQLTTEPTESTTDAISTNGEETTKNNNNNDTESQQPPPLCLRPYHLRACGLTDDFDERLFAYAHEESLRLIDCLAKEATSCSSVHKNASGGKEKFSLYDQLYRVLSTLGIH